MAGTESIEVRGSSLRTRRRLVVAAVVFALFVVFDIGLFAFLIFDSLSQRELEKVLLEAEAEARPIASELLQRARDVGADELLEIVTVDEQTETWIDQRLDGRRLVSTLEIRDADGNVIYAERREREATAALAGNEPPRIETGPADAVPELSPREPLVQESVEIPIGELGTLTLGLDESAVRERIGLLRRDLIRQTSVIGALTLVLLAVALIAFVVLLQRSRRLEDQAREAERMAYVGTLASGLAHEIRSPLNSLSLNMQMLEEEARETGESTSQARLLSITRSEIGRLETLATEFLTYARPRELELEDVAMGALLSRVRHVLDGELRQRRVDLELEDASGGALLRVDPAQILQLLLNLAQNSLAALEGVDAPLMTLIAAVDGGQPMLAVIDNGPGIAPEVRERMFELFYSNRKGGTGLGLAIVQRIAQAHDAAIEVETELGSGTEIRVRFPRARLAAPTGGRAGSRFLLGERSGVSGRST